MASTQRHRASCSSAKIRMAHAGDVTHVSFFSIIEGWGCGGGLHAFFGITSEFSCAPFFNAHAIKGGSGGDEFVFVLADECGTDFPLRFFRLLSSRFFLFLVHQGFYDGQFCWGYNSTCGKPTFYSEVGDETFFGQFLP